MEVILSKDPDLIQKMLNYIDALEKTNDELLATVKKCVKLLTQFKETVPDPQGWQGMLDLFQ